MCEYESHEFMCGHLVPRKVVPCEESRNGGSETGHHCPMKIKKMRRGPPEGPHPYSCETCDPEMGFESIFPKRATLAQLNFEFQADRERERREAQRKAMTPQKIQTAWELVLEERAQRAKELRREEVMKRWQELQQGGLQHGGQQQQQQQQSNMGTNANGSAPGGSGSYGFGN